MISAVALFLTLGPWQGQTPQDIYDHCKQILRKANSAEFDIVTPPTGEPGDEGKKEHVTHYRLLKPFYWSETAGDDVTWSDGHTVHAYDAKTNTYQKLSHDESEPRPTAFGMFFYQDPWMDFVQHGESAVAGRIATHEDRRKELVIDSVTCLPQAVIEHKKDKTITYEIRHIHLDEPMKPLDFSWLAPVGAKPGP
ncbi:MAG TPA: hypothetical protein VG944_16810 [Fimbriimonas sp.]|nr:hypothetical protein [Fimbriimonas sp.]